MLKKQTSKILVFLLMLGILYGCKRHLLDPLNPQTQLPPKVKLDKVKGFYENGRYKNQPKRTSSNGNERMTAADSARFKDFEPQWDKTEVELLPNNEKMLIVPVVRNLRVSYNQEIAFIRRLCIRVDANEDFLEANIVELVGNLTFVKENHNTIFKNYKENNIAGFSGAIAVYGLAYNFSSAEQFDNGTNTNNEFVTVFDGVSGCIKVCDEQTLQVIFVICPSPGDGDGGSGGTFTCQCPGGVHIPSCSAYSPPANPGTITPPYVHTPYVPHAPQGPGYTPPIYYQDGYYPFIGTGGSGYPYPTVGNPVFQCKCKTCLRPPIVVPPPPVVPFVPPPPPPMPHPGMYLEDGVWYFPPLPADPGVSWDHGWGDGVPRDKNGYEIVVNTAIEDTDGILANYVSEMKDVTTSIKTVLLAPSNPMKLTPAQLNVLRTTVLPEREKALAEANEMMTTTKAQYQIKYVANNADGGSTYYNPTTGKIVMEIINPNGAGAPKNGWSNAMHEMKHGFQFLEGKTSFDKLTGNNTMDSFRQLFCLF